MKKGVRVFVQTDGGHKGQEVRLLSYYDAEVDKVLSIWTGLQFCRKSSGEVAAGINLSLNIFRSNNSGIDGSTVDSGQGTPESFGLACKKLDLCQQHTDHQSCAIHDMQSVFCLVMQYCVGQGGLNNKNTVQFLHTLYTVLNV